MRHIIDTDRNHQGAMRVARYVAQERRAGRHPNTVALHRRARPVQESRVQHFLRIDRRQEA
jgi:hypothetical protein